MLINFCTNFCIKKPEVVFRRFVRFVRFVSYDNTSSIEDMLLINQKVNMDKRKQIQGVLKKKVVEEEEKIIFR